MLTGRLSACSGAAGDSPEAAVATRVATARRTTRVAAHAQPQRRRRSFRRERSPEPALATGALVARVLRRVCLGECFGCRRPPLCLPGCGCAPGRATGAGVGTSARGLRLNSDSQSKKSLLSESRGSCTRPAAASPVATCRPRRTGAFSDPIPTSKPPTVRAVTSHALWQPISSKERSAVARPTVGTCRTPTPRCSPPLRR